MLKVLLNQNFKFLLNGEPRVEYYSDHLRMYMSGTGNLVLSANGPVTKDEAIEISKLLLAYADVGELPRPESCAVHFWLLKEALVKDGDANGVLSGAHGTRYECGRCGAKMDVPIGIPDGLLVPAPVGTVRR